MRTICKALASLIFIGMAAFETYHSLLQEYRWPGFTLRSNYTAFILDILWISAAFALWSKRAWALPLVFLGIFASGLHTIFLSAGGAEERFLFFLATVALAFLVTYGRSQKVTGTDSAEDLLRFPRDPEQSPEPGTQDNKRQSKRGAYCLAGRIFW